MNTQYDLISSGMLDSAPRYTNMYLKDASHSDEIKSVVTTLVVLANAKRTDETVFVKEGTREVQFRVSDYQVPGGWNWSSPVNYSHRVGLRLNLVSAGRYILQATRPQFPADHFRNRQTTSDLTMSPAAFEQFWKKLEVNDRMLNINLVDVEKNEVVLDSVSGFYNIDKPQDKEQGIMATTNPGANGVSLHIAEFFSLETLNDISYQTVPVFGPLPSELKAWLGQVNKPVPNKEGNKESGNSRNLKPEDKEDKTPNLNDGNPTK